MSGRAEMLFGIFSVWFFCLGSIVGSFLNVCIWRIPRGESVCYPPSHCPGCNARIRWWQNIPVFSWIFLRGKCASCGMKISPRYIAVELLTGILFLLLFFQFGFPAFLGRHAPFLMQDAYSWGRTAAACFITAALVMGTFIDLDHLYLPDRITIGGMILGVPLSAAVPELQNCASWDESVLWSISGLAAGFLGLWLLRILAGAVFRREALGFGDVKLMGALGAVFGPLAVFVILILSAIVGSLFGFAMMIAGKTKLGRFAAIPFGPFIALAAFIWMVYGRVLWNWYVSMIVPAV